MTKYFEEIEVGEKIELGMHTFKADDIIRFAEKYDPQPFHLSEEGAAKTHFGRLCASGWHTASVFMKLLVATNKRLIEAAQSEGRVPARVGPSPGFEKLRWIKPVFAGDTLTYQRVVTGKTESRSRPEWGIVHSDMVARNQNDEPVFSFKANVFVERRRD
ncbi:MaoC family dehydratase [Roseibium alexandrii]|uniref:Acyl dehydratase n=1 Tax=Roseibium alexandrii (strain DSM 17067 / NCIMB 14079 / DFL-11) TaxID=244592 RepID=A0A5E8H1J2_ROSAD|nr:MaoC family dehydratase [Roseibium alexandrii]EEE45163.1 Acyl dehydratase [Roseibium alexandrii DFL-11]